MQSPTASVSGLSYFMRGFSLILRPSLRPFVLIPLTINLVLFSLAFALLLQQLDPLFLWLEQQLPTWLSWIEFILWPLAVGILLFLFSFVFSSVANFIAAPFNGLLAERVELELLGKALPDSNLIEVLKDLPRIFKREWQKIAYTFPRFFGCMMLFFIPLVGQTAAPILWFFFSAWIMAIQYLDYPFDNHKVDFLTMRETLESERGRCLSFGIIVTLSSALPLLNLLVMPVAVCGATALWVEQFRPRLVDLGPRS